MKKRDKSAFYLKNSDIILEMKMYKETGIVSENLGKMIVRIASNYSNIGSFSGYTWKEDMISEAVLTCLKYLHNFDIEKSNNPFAYFTTISKHAFINYIMKQKKHSSIKDICVKKRGIFVGKTGYAESAIDYEKLVE